MRELNCAEIALVTGGTGECTPDDPSGNNYYGIVDVHGVGDDLVEIYEGLVFATSHIIERVANAL